MSSPKQPDILMHTSSSSPNGSTTFVGRESSVQQQQQQQHHRPTIRILVISMGGHRRDMIEKMFCNQPNIEITFIDGIPARDLRTRTKLFYHCHRAQLIPPVEYDAYQNYITSNNPNHNIERNDLNWTKCFDGIAINPNRKGSITDKSLPYCVELWRKVKTINRGRSVLACFLVHLIALQKLTSENYDILIEDNVRCQNYNNDNPTALLQQIHQIRHATTTNNTLCHMRYYGWLGSIPNIHWIYQKFIPQYQISNPNIIVVPCPIPSDIIVSVEEGDGCLNIDNKMDDQPNGLDDDNDVDDVDDILETKEDLSIELPVASLSLLSSSKLSLKPSIQQKVKQAQQQQQSPHMLQPGGTNLVWGTYAYWISYEAYTIIIQTLQQDIGAIVWKGKRMRYYHVKPIDKVIPRIIRNHFDTIPTGNPNPTNTNATVLQTTSPPPSLQQSSPSAASTHQRSSCIQIPIYPIFFRAPMLSSNIHTKWDTSFCMSTHYQMQQMSLLPAFDNIMNHNNNNINNNTSPATTTTIVSSLYHDLFLSETERIVVNYAKEYNYQIWLTPQEIIDSTDHINDR